MSSKQSLESVKQPPRTIRIKRPRDETPVTSLYLDDSSPGDSKRLKTSTPSTPTYFFRLAHTVPTPFQPSTSSTTSSLASRSNRDQVPVVLDARKLHPKDQAPSSSGASTPLKRKLAPQDEPTSPSSEYDDGSASSVAGSVTPDSNISRAGTPSDTSRGPGAVRRFVLTRETKRKRMHPYRAVFERVQDTPSSSSIVPSPSAEITKQTGAVNGVVEPALSAPPSPPRKRKLPGIRKDPIERARIEKHQSQQKQKQQQQQRGDKNDEFDISEEMRKMVLDYLEADTRNALGGLPATTTSTTTTTTTASPAKPVDKIGGGLGGGTWDDTKPSSDAAMGNSDGEDDYVYDVYIREELNAEAANAGKEGENVGVIVFRGEEDEEWWYENADEDDPDDYAFDTDDEDSNAEDYIANEYPDEDEYEWASDDERGVWDSDDEEGMEGVVEYARGKPVHIGRMGRGARDSDEEFDLENDSSSDDEERIRRFVREAGV